MTNIRVSSSNSIHSSHIRPPKRRFTPREDRTILEMVNGFGTHAWAAIAQQLGGRTARQCRERYRHYLSPVIWSAPWTPEEDQLLRIQYQQHGPKWVQLSTLFPGRTAVNLKNRWVHLRQPNKFEGRLTEPGPRREDEDFDASERPGEKLIDDDQFGFKSPPC
jgi:hypothetical protein